MDSTYILADKPLGVTLEVGGNEIFIHPGIFYSFVIAFIITIFCLYTNYKVKKANPNDVPKGVVFFGEFFVNAINEFVVSNLGEKRLNIAPYIGMLGMFLVISNLSGLLGFVPPTSDYNVTLTLAIITILMAQYYAIKDNGIKSYFKEFTEPFAFMLPSNILDLFTTPLSMSLRLFGNILAGGIIMALIYQGTMSLSPLLSISVAPLFHAYFDIFAGMIQAFVFVLLTLVTIET